MGNTSQHHGLIITLSQIPSAAGTIVMRNQMRRIRQRESAQRWQRFAAFFHRLPDHKLITWRRRSHFSVNLIYSPGAMKG